MKITSVELHPDNSPLVAVLSFMDPSRQNPYNVKTMSGMDANAIVARFYGKSADGVKNFYNLAQQKRDYVLRVALNPLFSAGKSYSDLRDDLYRMIASSRTGLVQVQFKNGADIVSVISGQVSKLEATPFEKAPEVQLTISVDDPFFKAPVPVVVPVAGLNGADILIQDSLSTSPHGFDFVMNITTAFASLTISDPTDASWSFVVTPAGGFLAGDVLHFSSDPNNKQLYIVRGAATIYLADVLATTSVWPILFPFDNHLSFSNPADLNFASISYFPTYWGV